MAEATPVEARPSPEALLEEARRERTGRHKIFLGAAPGVGKTYEMLQAARRRKAAGHDVVVGVVETHGRLDTQALLAGLEQMPRRSVAYKGRLLSALDLDAILKRRPALVLIDELAHSNAPGSRHPKRHQDVEELLAAGIHVWSTLNIQHIESLNDVVARITRIRIRETVPDSVVDAADEIEVVDLTPEELTQRLREGKVYAPEQAQRALDHYFKPGNIAALRELALRLTAERVDRQMRHYMRTHAIRDTWAAGERVMVCVDESPSAADLVRAARRMAERLGAEWLAVHVETPRTHRLGDRERDRIVAALRLAEQLGARTLNLPGGRRIAEDVLAYARDNNVTQIVVGKAQRPAWFEWLHGSVVRELVRDAAGINIQVLAEPAPGHAGAASADPASRAAPATVDERPWTPRLHDYLMTTALVAAAIAVGTLALRMVDIPNISLVFIAAVLWSASRYGLAPSLYASVLSTLAYNFFFIPPLYTLTVADPSQVLALTFFCIVAAVTSTLTARERWQALAVREQARTTAELFTFSRRLTGTRKLDSAYAATAAQAARMLKAQAAVVLAGEDGGCRVAAAVPPSARLDDADLAAAAWCVAHRRPTGSGTDTLPGARWLFVPLGKALGSFGAVGLRREEPAGAFSPVDRRLIQGLVDLATFATERIRLAKDVDQARILAETEKLRSALLTSVSHDLRTPLASILGSLSALRSYADRTDARMRDDLLNTAIDEAETLNRYVGNLLDMTRLDSGSLAPRREACDLQDVVAATLRRCARLLAGRPLRVEIPDELPLLLLDDVLLEQVLINLVENAVRHAPGELPITIRAHGHAEGLRLSVRDQGPGISERDLERVFDKFYRGQPPSGDSQRAGTGLGLAICRGFVEAMGGRIRARNRTDPGGAEFILEFPATVLAAAAVPPAAGEDAA